MTHGGDGIFGRCHFGTRPVPSGPVINPSGAAGALQYFDVVMTGCRKPDFFSERNLLFAVSTADSRLSNTDNGAPVLPIDQADVPSSMPATTSPQMQGVVRHPTPPAPVLLADTQLPHAVLNPAWRRRCSALPTCGIAVVPAARTKEM